MSFYKRDDGTHFGTTTLTVNGHERLFSIQGYKTDTTVTLHMHNLEEAEQTIQELAKTLKEAEEVKKSFEEVAKCIEH